MKTKPAVRKKRPHKQEPTLKELIMKIIKDYGETLKMLGNE